MRKVPVGRKPKPTTIAIAEGTFRADRHGLAPQGDLLAETPSPPDYLCEVARMMWAELAPELVKLNLLEKRYLTLLAIACESFAEWRAAEETLVKEGTYFINLKTGSKQVHAAKRVSFQAREQFEKCVKEFGLSPSSSAGLGIRAVEGVKGISAFARKRKA